MSFRDKKFIYSYIRETPVFIRTDCTKAADSAIRCGEFVFTVGTVMCESAQRTICITGGDDSGSSTRFLSIDPAKDYCVTSLPSMNLPRSEHSSVFCAGALYVVGGHHNRELLSACERYLYKEERWEAVSGIPNPCKYMNLVALEKTNSIYTIGGFLNLTKSLDLIQRLDLSTQLWDVLPVKLPFRGFDIPCFQVGEGQIYIVMQSTLYCFNPLSNSLSYVRRLADDIKRKHSVGWFYRGVLFFSSSTWASDKYMIGPLVAE
mmetsp:Transcript_29114/g.52083  ORF Transcript_29114/g.52083 Transcript_29114/m.52083 type:complete len:262 (+) Transcript_29114:26-811(+)